jgi:hypothetical protein
LLPSLFLDIISFFSDKKESSYFLIDFFGIFGTGLIFFKNLEKVRSSGEVSEESTELRVLIAGSDEIGNIQLLLQQNAHFYY